VENDQQESVIKLAQAYDLSTKTFQSTLHKDLELSKKSARRVTKMVYYEMKNERVRTWEVL
jgi:hypothetical protein